MNATETPTRSAVISPDGKYRYHLRRGQPGGSRRVATFVMLNPSTADHLVDDPTIRKCMGFARRWGCGEVRVVNLFAVRATDPRDMMAASDPVGEDNHMWVLRAVDATRDFYTPEDEGLVVCAWGTHGAYMGQDQTVLGWIEGICRPMALGITKDGQPRHPLYVPYTTEIVPFTRRRNA